MKIERTRDAALIRQLATDPSIFPYCCDDYTRNPKDWQPIVKGLAVNLIAKDREGAFGLGMFLPRTHSCFEAHMGFLPRSYGMQAFLAFKLMLDWVFEFTTAKRLVGEIDTRNRRAIAFAKRCGFEEYGVNVKSILRGGVLRDQLCLGISKA